MEGELLPTAVPKEEQDGVQNGAQDPSVPPSPQSAPARAPGPGPAVHCFSQEAMDALLHFQILLLPNQLYAWIGCNSGRMGHMFAAVPPKFDAVPSVSLLLGGGGGADSPGASFARRLAMKTNMGVVLSSNLPSNSPLLEASAERLLLQKLRELGLPNLGGNNGGGGGS